VIYPALLVFIRRTEPPMANYLTLGKYPPLTLMMGGTEILHHGIIRRKYRYSYIVIHIVLHISRTVASGGGGMGGSKVRTLYRMLLSRLDLENLVVLSKIRGQCRFRTKTQDR